MTAGDPIPLLDGRRLWLDINCVITTPIPDFEDMLSRDEEEEPSHPNDPFYDFYEDILFALRLGEKPEEEWSRYEKRRMRRCAERITSFDIEFAAAASAAMTPSDFARVCKRFGLQPLKDKKGNQIYRKKMIRKQVPEWAGAQGALGYLLFMAQEERNLFQRLLKLAQQQQDAKGDAVEGLQFPTLEDLREEWIRRGLRAVDFDKRDDNSVTLDQSV